jgi:hypothetical protein
VRGDFQEAAPMPLGGLQKSNSLEAWKTARKLYQKSLEGGWRVFGSPPGGSICWRPPMFLGGLLEDGLEDCSRRPKILSGSLANFAGGLPRSL